MPDPNAQGVSSLAVNFSQTQITQLSLPVQAVAGVVGKKSTTKFYQTLDEGAIAQVSRFNAVGTMAVNDTCHVTVTDADANIFKYVLDAAEAKTLDELIDDLISLVNLDDDVVVSRSATGTTIGTITITSANPGRAFTIAVGMGGANTGTVSLGTIATVTANAAGTLGAAPKSRLVAEADAELGVDTSGNHTITYTTRFYSGAAVPGTAVQTTPSTPFRHPSTVSQIKTAQNFV